MISELEHMLTATDAAILGGTCMLVGSFMVLIGFKIAPMVKRYFTLLRLKIYMLMLSRYN
jgi:hypothetical protein